MFNSKALLASTLAAIASFTAGDAHRPKHCTMSQSLSPFAAAGVGVGCAAIPTVSDTCVNLTGGLSFLNKEISTATVLGGFVCTFFQDFGCTASGVINAGTNSQVF
ncbi:hypothetical protein B0H14DRAFT_3037825 [Mycena olivaceomarginata]|nr:hypothetical protein B0H14DRAFT_3037825 [Mycena olivaceomarginata]